MHIQQDFEELLALLEKHKVKYMVVGGYAVAFHGYPRFTKDIDVFYERTPENVKNLMKVLVAFGFPPAELSEDIFKTKGNIITFGVEPVRVDIINDISGIEFGEAWPSHVRGKYGKTEVNFIGKLELIKNKSSTKRSKDKVDVEGLS
jgi:hypothetical protein